jgi:capsular polysaccharide transport system permease protein
MSYAKKIRNKLTVIRALMLRDAMARFGRENLGFFWLMGEPLIITIGIIVIWTVLGATHGHTNVDVIAFGLSGYTLLTLWRHIINRSVYCFRHSAGLLFHRNIALLDTFVARTLIESVGTGAAFFVAYVPLFLLGYIDPINDPLILIAAWLLMILFSFSVGLTIACMTEISEPFEFFVAPIMYFMLPISGTFYMVDWLPEKYQRLAAYSPLINLNEMFRDGLYGDKTRTYWNVSMILLWSVPLLAMGFLLIGPARRCMRSE